MLKDTLRTIYGAAYQFGNFLPDNQHGLLFTVELAVRHYGYDNLGRQHLELVDVGNIREYAHVIVTKNRNVFVAIQKKFQQSLPQTDQFENTNNHQDCMNDGLRVLDSELWQMYSKAYPNSRLESQPLNHIDDTHLSGFKDMIRVVKIQHKLDPTDENKYRRIITKLEPVEFSLVIKD